jgi:hypothetical protein
MNYNRIVFRIQSKKHTYRDNHMSRSDNFIATMSYSWGCEFVDDGMYGTVCVSRFRDHGIPISIVEMLVDQAYIQQIFLTDREHIDQLVSSMQVYGVKVPVSIIFDNENVRLQDGNHRFLAARHLGLKYLPANLVYVENIKARSVKLKNFVQKLMEEKWLEK